MKAQDNNLIFQPFKITNGPEFLNYSNINKPNNMYTPKKRYQDGGQMQQAPDEMQIVEAVLQAFSQLSPQGQQMVLEQIGQMMSAQQAPQAPMEEQYVPPTMRNGGKFRRY